MTSPPDFIRTADAAKILGVHTVTVLRWISEGLITKSQKLAGQTTSWVHDRAEIEALAAEKASA